MYIYVKKNVIAKKPNTKLNIKAFNLNFYVTQKQR